MGEEPVRLQERSTMLHVARRIIGAASQLFFGRSSLSFLTTGGLERNLQSIHIMIFGYCEYNAYEEYSIHK